MQPQPPASTCGGPQTPLTLAEVARPAPAAERAVRPACADYLAVGIAKRGQRAARLAATKQCTAGYNGISPLMQNELRSIVTNA